MATTLIVNPGSSSKKYALYKEGVSVFSVRYEKTGDDYVSCNETSGGSQTCEAISSEVYDKAFNHFLDRARTLQHLSDEDTIQRIGIRIVAPGTFFQVHRIVDDAYSEALKNREFSAPLHIPAMLNEIHNIRYTMPETPLVAVSDSAFHATMPYSAQVYSFAKRDVEEFDIKRFGYHGLSVASVARRAPQVLGASIERMIVCHIGSGVSVSAVQNRKSIDTSMGFSPSSGLPMGTRSGDADAGALLELMRAKQLSVHHAETYIQKEGGLKGQCGEADLRNLLERKAGGDVEAKQALDHFFYHLQKQIGSFVVALGGLDAVVLTATASERNPTIRQLLLEGLESVGVILDTEANDGCVGRDGVISHTDSPVKILVVKTDEMGEMLRVTEATT